VKRSWNIAVFVAKLVCKAALAPTLLAVDAWHLALAVLSRVVVVVKTCECEELERSVLDS